MRIMKTTSKILAGLMIVPLSMGILINTFCPRVLQIGSLTTATPSNAGAAPSIGVQLLGIGIMLEFRDMPQVSKRGSVLFLSKFLVGVVIGLTINAIFGGEGLFGLTTLALISAITNSNGSVYTVLMTTYGDKTDCVTVGMLTSNDGPFLILATLRASDLVNIPLMSLVAVLVPLVVDMTPNNSDEDCNKFFAPLVSLVVPLAGLTLGGSTNLVNIVKGGPPGTILRLLATYIAGPSTIFCDRKVPERNGYAGPTVSTTADNSIAAPVAVALTDPAWQPCVTEATTQTVTAAVITAIVIPIATGAWIKRLGSPKNPMNGHIGEAWQDRRQAGVNGRQINERRKDMYNALIIEKNDDVAVVLEVIRIGDKVTYWYDDEERSVVSFSGVPVYYKVAVHDIKRGGHILKYDKKLGVATQDIKLGKHVHTQNLDSEREDLWAEGERS